MSMEETFTIIQLRDEISNAHIVNSTLINLMEQIKIACDEDDLDEVKKLIGDFK